MEDEIKKAKESTEQIADAVSATTRFAKNLRSLGSITEDIFGKYSRDINRLIISMSNLDEAFSLDHYINKIKELESLQTSAKDIHQKEIDRMKKEIQALLSSAQAAKLFDYETIIKNAKAKHEKIVGKSVENYFDELVEAPRSLSKILSRTKFGPKLGALFEASIFKDLEKGGLIKSIGKGITHGTAQLGMEGLSKLMNSLNMVGGVFTKISLASAAWVGLIKTAFDVFIGGLDLSRKFKSLSASIGIIGGFSSVDNIKNKIFEKIDEKSVLKNWASTGKFSEVMELIPTTLKQSNMFSRELGEGLGNISKQMYEIISTSAVFNYTLEQAAEHSMRIYSAFGDDMVNNFKRLNLLSRSQMMGFEEFFGNMGGFESVFTSFGETMTRVSYKIASTMENFTKKLDKTLIQRSLIGLYSNSTTNILGTALAMGGMEAYNKIVSGKPESYIDVINSLYQRVKKNISQSPLRIAGEADFLGKYFGADVAKRYAFNREFRESFEKALKYNNEEQIEKLVEEASKNNLMQRSLDSIAQSVGVLQKIVNYIEDIKQYFIFLINKLPWGGKVETRTVNTSSAIDYGVVSSSKGGRV